METLPSCPFQLVPCAIIRAGPLSSCSVLMLSLAGTGSLHTCSTTAPTLRRQGSPLGRAGLPHSNTRIKTGLYLPEGEKQMA